MLHHLEGLLGGNVVSGAGPWKRAEQLDEVVHAVHNSFLADQEFLSTASDAIRVDIVSVRGFLSVTNSLSASVCVRDGPPFELKRRLRGRRGKDA